MPICSRRARMICRLSFLPRAACLSGVARGWCAIYASARVAASPRPSFVSSSAALCSTSHDPVPRPGCARLLDACRQRYLSMSQRVRSRVGKKCPTMPRFCCRGLEVCREMRARGSGVDEGRTGARRWRRGGGVEATPELRERSASLFASVVEYGGGRPASVYHSPSLVPPAPTSMPRVRLVHMPSRTQVAGRRTPGRRLRQRVVQARR